MGVPNQAALVQEFLRGDEYFINTVSRDGLHHVAEVWRYHKTYLPGRGHIYDYEEPVAWVEDGCASLRSYTLGVLDALEIIAGPAHTEVIVTAGGPVLLETGARLAGSVLPDVVTRCFGTSQVELTALAFADRAAFQRQCGRPYQLHNRLRYVSLIVAQPSVVGEQGLEAMTRLESYAGMLSGMAPGMALVPTVDSKTSPGVVYLLADDPAVVARDYAALRHLELTSLYLPRSVPARSGKPVT
jgi:biotin carboxylase